MKNKIPSLAQVAELLQTHQATIPEEYLDEMGHMNVMWYTHLFSNAMRHMFREVGIDHSYMESEQAGTFALETHVHYFSEVRVNQQVEIYTRILARSGKTIHSFHYMINRDKNDIAAVFEAISAHTDMTVRRSAPFPGRVCERIDQLIAKQGRLAWQSNLCGVIHTE